MSNIQMAGFKELSDKLKELPEKVRKTALRKATKEASAVVLKEAFSRIPKGDPKKPHKTYKGNIVFGGYASRNIRAVVKLARNKKTGYARIGVAPEAFYALSFVELGNGQKEQPWLVPALQSQTDSVIQTYRRVLGRAIELAAKRQKRAQRIKV